MIGNDYKLLLDIFTPTLSTISTFIGRFKNGLSTKFTKHLYANTLIALPLRVAIFFLKSNFDILNSVQKI